MAYFSAFFSLDAIIKIVSSPDTVPIISDISIASIAAADAGARAGIALHDNIVHCEINAHY